MFGLIVALARGVHFAAVLLLFGSLVIATFVAPAATRDAPPEAARRVTRQLVAWVRGSGLLALLLGVVWLPIQATEMSGASTLADIIQATPIALLDTRYGEALMLRGAMLVMALLLAGSLTHRVRTALALLPAAVAVVAQSWMGHPAAADDAVLLGASMAHVLAAGAWLGALIPLFLVVKALPGAGAARASGYFSWIGQLSVVVLAVTAWLQGVSLIGNEGGLLGTKYGQIASFKLVLFGVLFLFAVVNRFKLTPKLAGTDVARAKRHLTTSIVIETVLGLLVVLAASWLATGTPATHEEPNWPFPLRPDWPILDDPLVRNAFIEAGALLLVALLLLGRAALFRRWRWIALALIPGLVWYSNKLINDAPFLDPILTDANPASYYFAQGGFSVDSIAAGSHVFAQNCVPCHGSDAQGDGPAAKLLPVPPANLTQEHVWMHSDGDLFWWLTDGIDVPPHGKVMPAWGSILSTDDRWNLIDFIHAHLAGYQMAGKGLWTIPIAAPSLAVVCSNGKQFDLTDLKGKFVQLIAVGPNDNPPAPSAVQQVLLMKRRVEMPGCVAEGENSWLTYAVLAHIPPDQLAGTQFLIDPDGWVRWTLAAKDAAQWADPQTLKSTMAQISAKPLVSDANAMANMKM
jgi:putative copper export protein/mono/diheme cytochrome c family protein